MSDTNPAPNRVRHVIVAITGASGAIFGVRCLEAIGAMAHVESHLIVSPAGRRTIQEETDLSVKDVEERADHVENYKDIGASIASGSFRTAGMIVAPCTIRTLSGIANSYDENLVVRAADVCLKERRRLVLMLRETPLHAGHIELMDKVTRAGAIVMPPVPAFYHRPATIDELVNHTVGRALELLGLENELFEPWVGAAARARSGPVGWDA